MYLQKYINYKQKYLDIKQNMYGGSVYCRSIPTHTDKILKYDFESSQITINDVKKKLAYNSEINYAIRYGDTYYVENDQRINTNVIDIQHPIKILQSIDIIKALITPYFKNTVLKLFDTKYLLDYNFLQFLIILNRY